MRTLEAVLLLALVTWFTHPAAACRGRKVLNSTAGVIRDGEGKYPMSAHCEWLIVGGADKFINLRFDFMETECSYDYLFVYDGDSYNSRLLGSFSGSTTPDLVLARSGYMLIYFYSDRNYILLGFDATYTVTDCPYNCSQRGICNTHSHTCTCNHGYVGEGCERELCPSMCGKHGTCSQITSKCVCDTGYTGYDCSLRMTGRQDLSSFHQVAPPGVGFQSRTGHAGVFIKALNAFYMFGGFTLNSLLDELIRYNFAQNHWEVLPRTLSWPSARQKHAMVDFNGDIYMYGGILENGSHSQELWLYSVTNQTWSLKAATSTIKPLGVASHTLTVVDDQWLYLLGGQSSEGIFLSDMYKLDATVAEQWHRVIPRGGKEADRRLVGHSTIYHPESRSLLVFGGFMPDYAKFPKRTNRLHAYHIDDNYWSLIQHDMQNNSHQPKNRAFHTATRIANYMVIYGGNSHIHHKEEVCYDDAIYFYHLGCHRWISLKELESPDIEEGFKPKGRFSQVAAVAWGNTLLISGGYRGNVLGDLIAYTVPLIVAKNQNDTTSHEDPCQGATKDVCQLDPECVWCLQIQQSTTALCLHRNQAKNCQRVYHQYKCPGICSTLGDCNSCAVQGQGANRSSSAFPSLWHNEKCSWCVKEAKCQSRDKPDGACDTLDSQMTTEPWWGWNSSRMTSLAGCREYDYPAGLHFLKYLYPADFDHPDEVEIIRTTDVNFQFNLSFPKERVVGGDYTVEFRGFIHPLGAPSSLGDPLQVMLVALTAHAFLYISSDASPETKELVAEVQPNTFGSTIAKRPDGSRIFPYENRGHKYYVLERASQLIAPPRRAQMGSTMQLRWKGVDKNRQFDLHTLSVDFLEPYNSDSCDGYDSCLGCMTDTSCGWCVTSSTCVLRSTTDLSLEQCGIGGRYLVMQASDCPVCADYLDCHSCTQESLCEWLTSEARCLRRGRFDSAVRNETECPIPCHIRTNCSWCVREENECAWCEQTHTCFPFMEYVLKFAYGGCTHWVDSTGGQQCRDCTRHLTCKDCQANYKCGWCGNIDNPTIGRCMEGDFVGPAYGEECSSLTARAALLTSMVSLSPGVVTHNTSGRVSTTSPTVTDVTRLELESQAWSYGVCPDVEECRLGLHDCHGNATCKNTFTSFVCVCNRGFQGDGKQKCDRTCYYNCVHGECSGAPDYNCECDIGWTGEECNTNCGCNNHSTCLTGVGKCDKCVHWTTDEFCQMCRPGSYGNATASAKGCRPCECNEHADESAGYCDSLTGKCFCTDNTVGDRCQRCKPGYYGNPRRGGTCFLKCDGRTILGNVTSGGLGSHEGIGVVDKARGYCLWILTVHSDLTNLRSVDVVPTITFTMQTDIQTECSRDFVYVYDGIPGFMTSTPASSAILLGAFCGYGATSPISVEARSGYLTVYFEANVEPAYPSPGFNATYRTNSCPGNCGPRRKCVKDKCVCKEGYGGIDCTTTFCPSHCLSRNRQGVCDRNLGQCVCAEDFGGPDCSYLSTANQTYYNPLFDPWRVSGIGAFNSSLARMGHSLVTCGNNELYMFGGYSLSRGALNDLWKFDIETGLWEELRASNTKGPKPRYFHGAVCIPALHAMYVYGGLGDKEGAMREMWKYNLDSSRWSKLQIRSETDIPAMAGHTMTLIDDTKLVIIGGISSNNYFSDCTYQYDTGLNQWKTLFGESLKPTGAGPTGVYGHSTVYHRPSSTLYVFGGYEYQTHVTVKSNNLYAFDLRKNVWTYVPAEPDIKPVSRFFHTAVTTDKYMLVMGGRTSDHDFDTSVLVYRYSCSKWMTVTPEATNLELSGVARVVGGASVIVGRHVYTMGGFSGLSHGTLLRLNIPEDLCRLHTNVTSCLDASGCSACVIDETNQTICYDNRGPKPTECQVINSTVSFHEGPVCDVSIILNRVCEQHKSCRACLAQWPIHRGHRDVCQWCSNCPTGKCIPKNADCAERNSCQRKQNAISNVSKCIELVCQAADCSKCWRLGSCIWSRHFKRSGEVGRTLALNPIYDWNCVAKSLLEATTHKVQSMPPNECPLRCYKYPTCQSCLSSIGGEGGSQECLWSVPLQECMPPTLVPLRCANGECGQVLSGSDSECPQPCGIYKQCSTCLSSPGCGWCAYSGLNGKGVCMDGGLTGPVNAECSDHNVTDVKRRDIGSAVWAFGKCPAENECINGHHNCDDSEDCIDLPVSFKCSCKPGFVRDKSSGRCKPVCSEGCVHGTCVEPNVCRCYFSYIGHNCTTKCLCNEHSNCKSVAEKDVCIKCKNNTQGSQCGECKPLSVGDPQGGGKCNTCFSVCNKHSEVCLSSEEYNMIAIQPGLPLAPENVTQWVKQGTKTESNVVCVNCQNNTKGSLCEECQDGFFREKHKTLTDACQPCECHGHSDICDRTTGVNCDCKNNTKSPRCDESSKNPDSSNEPCWKNQCSKCIDNFQGTPTGGHQCYRQMTADRDYCFDPETQMNCNRDTAPLRVGRTVFFAVQPKYLNVDIRIVLDVTKGGVDVYLSPFGDSYQVLVDPSNGVHTVLLDPNYAGLAEGHSFKQKKHRHRRAGSTVTTSEPARNTTTPDVADEFRLGEVIAKDFNTFLTVNHQSTFLIMRDVRHRVVITLPNAAYNLQVARFYLVMYGKGSETDNLTYGNVFFRQDQPHIDLFVFFSVFFSCFFLFLAVCVLLWKTKQVFDSQRSRQRRRIQMQHMASRPFSKVTIVIDQDRKIREPPAEPHRNRLLRFSSKYSLTSHQQGGRSSPDAAFHVNPVAMEPTDDGIAAIGTFFFVLPGRRTAQVQSCLGSALITMRVMYPCTYHLPKSNSRRPPSVAGNT